MTTKTKNQRPKAAKVNPTPADFAALASGLLSAVQIGERLGVMKTTSRKRKTVTRKRRRNPETQAQINARMAKARAARKSNPVKTTLAKVTPKKVNPRKSVTVPAKGRFYLMTIAKGDDVLGVFINDRDGDGITKKFKNVAAAKAYATKNRLRLENPAKTKKVNPAFAPKWIKALLAGSQKSVVSSRQKANPVRTASGSDRAKPAAKKANPTRKAASVKAAPTAPKRKANPKVSQSGVPRRRTFEMFNGRPATKSKIVPCSKLLGSGARVDQLGKLHEIHMESGEILKLNPAKFSLVAKGGRLWIVGGKFHSGPKVDRKINPWGKIKNIVYSTHKPHHGDRPGQHYIHEMGEWSGNRPTLSIDNHGYPVIQGGSYKIEARGIVD